MLQQWLYDVLKMLVGICFNILNLILAGNLPPLGSVNIIITEQDKYLVIERPEGGFVFPGGYMRWREHPEQTVLREGNEETGLRLKVNELFGCCSNTSDNFTGLSTLSLMYHAEVVDGELRNSIEGRPCWLDEAELRSKLKLRELGMLDLYLRRVVQRDITTNSQL